jgi:hypothetical protein
MVDESVLSLPFTFGKIGNGLESLFVPLTMDTTGRQTAKHGVF